MPRWIVRAHRHFYSLLDDEDLTIVQNPCWQLPTPYATKGNHWKWQPDIGGVLMVRDEEEDSNYRFRRTLYATPEWEVLVA